MTAAVLPVVLVLLLAWSGARSRNTSSDFTPDKPRRTAARRRGRTGDFTLVGQPHDTADRIHDRKAGASRTALPFPPWRLSGGSLEPRLSIVRARITGSTRYGFPERHVLSADAPARSAIPRSETENLGSALWRRGE